MIKIIVPRNESSDDKFETYLKPSLEKLKNKLYFTVIYNSDVEQNNSIFSKYNLGVQLSSYKDDDIIVFCHADIKIHDPHFIEKIELVFSERQDIGLLGVIGTTSYNGSGWWICDPTLHRGSIIQGKPGTDGKETFLLEKKIGFFDDMVVVDGCFFCVRGKVAKAIKFNEEAFKGSYHFYDVDYCISVLEAGWKIAVADISVEHASPGPLNESWEKARDISNGILAKKGYSLPITTNSFKK